MNETVLAAVGDIMLGREVGNTISQNGPEYPFSKIKDCLAGADVTFGVLSAPFVAGSAHEAKKPEGCPAIKASPESSLGLVSAGFNMLHIGNNHILDYGTEGLKATTGILTKSGINYIGAGMDLKESRKPAIIEKNNIRFGFLGYCMSYPASDTNAGCAPLKLKYISEDIDKLRGRADFVIVSLHHGIEYSFYPHPEYIKLAHGIIDSGADVILGHHPHVLQGYEIYKGKLIAYSLGNFVFDRDDKKPDIKNTPRIRFKLERDGVIAVPGAKEFYRSAILKVIFNKKSVLDFTFLPVVINDNFQPELAQGDEKDEITHFLREKYQNLKTLSPAFYNDLSNLYAQESVRYWLRADFVKIIANFYKIRPSHIRQVMRYIYSSMKGFIHGRLEGVR